MGLETYGRANIGTEDFDGRQLELTTLFDVSGNVELDPSGAEWEAQKLAYGRQVALQVADRAVLQMATMFGFNGRMAPAAGISARNSLHNRWEMGKVGNGVLAIRQQIGGVFRLTSDRDLEPGELILAARDAIAVDVASLAVFALEQRFEGKQTNRSDTQIRRENGQIVEFQRQNVPLPDGGPPRAA